MTSTVHIAETALLLLAAYLAGCILGYAAHRILHAGRGTRQPTAVAAPPVAETPPAEVPAAPRRSRTPAARLAAAASPEPMPDLGRKPAPRPRRQPSDPRPAALDVPRDGKADDLKQIKGIGPKIEASLNSLGIFHLDQIARWNKANIDWVDGQLAFKGRIRRERWVEQATELSKGKVSA